MRARQFDRAPSVVVMTAKELTDADRLRLNGAVRDVIETGATDLDGLLDDVRRRATAHARRSSTGGAA